MDLNEFLRAGGADLADFVAKVDSTVGLGADDLLLVVGSLVEGLGNRKSDLDLLLITPRAGLLPQQGEIALVAGRCLADLRVLRSAQVADLVARLEGWSRLPWDVTHAVSFTKEERVLLHRLLYGLPLLHDERSAAEGPPRPALAAVARLKLHVARQLARTIQVDMVGYRESSDYPSLAFAAQELLGHAVDALLAAHGLTNPLSKWRSRLLETLPPDWEPALQSRPSGTKACELFWRLHRAPERPEAGPCLEHALRIATFARAAFVWAERRLVQEPAPSDGGVVWPQLERRPADAPLPHLDFDVDFLLVDGVVAIGRLNDFGVTLRLSPSEFACALLFDGTTTAREAAAAIYGRDETAVDVVQRLVSQVGAARLSAP